MYKRFWESIYSDTALWYSCLSCNRQIYSDFPSKYLTYFLFFESVFQKSKRLARLSYSVLDLTYCLRLQWRYNMFVSWHTGLSKLSTWAHHLVSGKQAQNTIRTTKKCAAKSPWVTPRLQRLVRKVEFSSHSYLIRPACSWLFEVLPFRWS